MKFTDLLGLIAAVAILFCLFSNDSPVEATSVSHALQAEQQAEQQAETVRTLQSLVARLEAQAEQAKDHDEQLSTLSDEVAAAKSSFVAFQEELQEELQAELRAEAEHEHEHEQSYDEIAAELADAKAKLAEAEAELASRLEAPVKSLGSSGSTLAPVTVTYSYESPGPTQVKSGGSNGGTYQASSGASRYQARWTNYDGLTKTQHAAIEHGLDVSSMTPDQIAMRLDHDHDTYGPGHAMTRSRTRAVSYGDCPNGQCPQSPSGRLSYNTSSGGLLGFGVFGRRR